MSNNVNDSTEIGNEENEYKALMIEQQKKVDSLFDVKLITPENSVICRTPGGFASLVYEEKEYKRVAFFRAFPFSAPEKYISIRDITPKSEEIGMIIDLADWPADLASIIREQLNIRYFTPKIIRIREVKEEFGFAYWVVDTDRGEMNITTSIWNPIFRLGDKKLLVNDLDSNRYEIEDVNKLSRKEIKMIDLFL